jgi:putative transposase
VARNETQKFSPDLLDRLLAGRDPKRALDSSGLIGDLKKALAERMLNAEMDVHLAHEAQAGMANHRNGASAKTVLTPDGSMELSIPRDRHGRFDSALIAKYRRRFPGFDEKIIALYRPRPEHARYPGPCARALRR